MDISDEEKALYPTPTFYKYFYEKYGSNARAYEETVNIISPTVVEYVFLIRREKDEYRTFDVELQKDNKTFKVIKNEPNTTYKK